MTEERVMIWRGQVSATVWEWLCMRVGLKQTGDGPPCIVLINPSDTLTELRDRIAFEQKAPELVRRFWVGYNAEHVSAKKYPNFCMMGKNSFQEFCGMAFIMAKDNGNSDRAAEILGGKLTFAGIKCLVSFNNEEGFIFGHDSN